REQRCGGGYDEPTTDGASPGLIIGRVSPTFRQTRTSFGAASYCFAGRWIDRPFSFTATMNSRNRRFSVVLGCQCEWIVPAGTKRLSPAFSVTGSLPSSCQIPVPDRTWKVIAAGCRCRGLMPPGTYSAS